MRNHLYVWKIFGEEIMKNSIELSARRKLRCLPWKVCDLCKSGWIKNLGRWNEGWNACWHEQNMKLDRFEKIHIILSNLALGTLRSLQCGFKFDCIEQKFHEIFKTYVLLKIFNAVMNIFIKRLWWNYLSIKFKSFHYREASINMLVHQEP